MCDFTIRSSLTYAANLLRDATDTPQLEAEILLTHILGKDRIFLLKEASQKLGAKDYEKFFEHVKRRLDNEPIAYITNDKEFWSRNFFIDRSVLVPRVETETIIEAVLAVGEGEHGINQIVDLGTGSGIIAITLAKAFPNWNIIATDNSSHALHIAKHNANLHNTTKIFFIKTNWLDVFSENSFNIIITNPPYLSEAEYTTLYHGLKFEPKGALVAGTNGLEALEQIIILAKSKLKKYGWMFLEHGSNQQAQVHNLLIEHGFGNISAKFDLNGLPRVIIAQK